MEFNNVWKVKRTLSDKDFIRAVLVHLASDDDTPVDITQATFGNVQTITKEVFVLDSKVEVDYTCEIGMDKEEVYYVQEKKLKNGPNGKSYYVYEDVEKKRKYTDWMPHSGRRVETITRGYFNESTQLDYPLNEILSGVDLNECEEGEPTSIDAQAFNCAERDVVERTVKRISFPGDHYRNLNYSSTVDVLNIVCLQMPWCEVSYTYKGKSYRAKGFACGHICITATTPPNDVDIQALAKAQNNKWRIAKNIAWSAFAALYACAWALLFAAKLWWSWAFPTATVAAAIALHFIYDRKYNGGLKMLKSENIVAKREAVTEALSMHGFTPLTTSEREKFNEESGAKAYVYAYGKKVWGLAIVTILLTAVLAFVGCSIGNAWRKEANRQRQEQYLIPANITVELDKKTGSMDYTYTNELTFTIYNNSIYACEGLNGSVRFYDDDYLFGNGSLSIRERIPAHSSRSVTVEYSGVSTIHQTLYETPYENLGLTFQLNSVSYETSTGIVTRYNDNPQYITIKESGGDGTPDGGQPSNPSAEYTVYFKADGRIVSQRTYTEQNKNVTLPQVPEKAGYTGVWENFTLTTGNITVNAIYTPIVYTVTFKTDGTTAFTRTYTVENKLNFVTPQVPEKAGYTGVWENFTLTTGNITVNAIYTLKPPTQGLEYALSADGDFYAVSWIGTATDKDIVVPASYQSLPVKEIGAGAFNFCDITGITLPDSIAVIGNGAFSNCSSLTHANIGKGIVAVEDKAFYQCNQLKSITLPDSTQKIGGEAFYSCTRLQTVTVNENSQLKSIGEDAFRYTALTEFTIPNATQTIGAAAFESCDRLQTVTINENSQLKSIGENAFRYTALTAIRLPQSLTSLRANAFDGCRNLIQQEFGISYVNDWIVDADTSIGRAQLRTGTRGIADKAFSDCSSLASITIPDSVTSIGDSAFSYCRSLTSITIPDSVTSIGKYAFSSCSSLTSVTFADTSTWYRTDNSDYTGGTKVNVTNPSSNASSLKNYYWYKI